MKKFLPIIVTIMCILFSPVICGEGETVQTAVPQKEKFVSYGEMSVHFIDVGQGDCQFIEFPDGKTMLIDAGNPWNSDEIAKYIKNEGYGRLDYVIATHPHSDHIGGMAEIIRTFEIGEFFMPDVTHTTQAYEKMISALDEMNVKVSFAVEGLYIMDEEYLKVKILSPPKKNFSNLNNYSVVTDIDYGEVSFLFMGDAEEMMESEISDDTDILKVGHHGSRDSTSIGFLKKISPETAVISCGINNQYDYPSQEVMDNLYSCGAKIYRTDLDGTVTITTDGRVFIKRC